MTESAWPSGPTAKRDLVSGAPSPADEYVSWLGEMTHKLRRGALSLGAVENALLGES